MVACAFCSGEISVEQNNPYSNSLARIVEPEPNLTARTTMQSTGILVYQGY